jgi:Predicted branched-chain amino acid permease (azaleucine resistance)
MINSKYFFQGILASKKFDSPAIALGASFVAIGALLKNLGFTIQESIFSTLLTYALPGSLVMAESMLIGASLVNIFLAVWLVNSRLYPMTVSIMPLLKHESQPRWKYYLSCHFVAVSSWLILKSNYEEIERKYRLDFWIGIGTATWLVAIFSTIVGYYASDFLIEI